MRARSAKIALFVVLAGAVALAVLYRDRFDAIALQAWIENAGIWAPLLFMLIYAAAAVLFLPGSVMTLAGGALFGPVLGSLYNLTGATIGASLAFLLARYLASDWVEQRSGGRLKQLVNGVEAEGWRFVAFVRLVPLFPFNLLNYALGLTRIRFLHYLLASYIFMLPGAVAYTYLGYAGREAIAGGEGLVQKIIVALALLAVVAFLPRLIGRWRKGPCVTIQDLKKRLDTDEDILVLDVRTGEDFHGEQGYIASARNIPLEELPKRLGEIQDYRENPVVTICRTDRRSAAASRLLAENGFNNVCVGINGMTEWNKNGYPVKDS